MPVDPLEFEQRPETDTALGDKWGYDTFRHYLVGITRGRDFILPQEQFPKEIELSTGWHGVFDNMRAETSSDGKERWAGIGYKTNEVNQRALYLPEFPAIGSHHQIPGEVIAEERTRMGRVAGLETIIGDIHSHPRKIRKNIPVRLLSLVNNPSFSVGDLYRLVYETTDYYLMGLVDGVDNMMAFSTRESRSQVVDHRLVTQNIFKKYWYENNGWKYLGRENDQWPYAEPTRPNPTSPMDLARMIAARHHLVVYKGVQGGKLKRIV